MRVMYLVPPSNDGDRISAFSHVSEEIEALCDGDVDAYCVVRDGEPKRGRYFRRFVPMTGKWLASIQALSCVVRYPRLLARLFLRFPQKTLFHVRLERYVADVVRANGIDFIHSHFAWPGGMGGVVAARIADVPLLTSLRGMDVMVDEEIEYGNRRNPFFAAALHLLLTNATRVTAVSEFIRDLAIENGAPEERVSTILKGVHLEKFSPDVNTAEARNALGLSQKFTILAVGGLIPCKGMDQIIRAAARLQLDYQLVICGQGPELTSLKSLAESLGVAGRVRFDGQVSRELIPTYFSACDVFILASRIEASGNVLCEALASGRPVITTRSGGPPEYIRDGLTGSVVAPNDDAELAEQIEFLAGNRVRWNEMSKNARHEAESRFAYSVMIDKIRETYSSLLDDRPYSAQPK